MTFPIPTGVEAAIGRLECAGFRAYLVGGCVRDMLRGVMPNDYDVTTAALPEQVKTVFKGERVIDTGIRHGTVTLLTESGPVEITTFRLDGAYHDHRRPDSVTFTPSLTEDLARRDFTVNAMAWGTDGLTDPFGGQNDLERRVLRCVGEPAHRFDEDGLRILRALRFAATLGFAVDEATAAAVHAQRNLLDAISAERKFAELTKWICGDGAEPILREYRDVLETLIPELRGAPADWSHLPRLPSTREVRLAALLSPLDVATADAVLARFKSDNATRRRVTAILAHRDAPLASRAARLRLAHAVGFAAAQDVAHLRLDQAALDDLIAAERDGAPVSTAALAVNGTDLAALGIRGKAVGATLERLLLAVMDGAVPNDRAALLEAAQQ